MEKQTTPQTERTLKNTNSPSWWTSQHTSAWDRVKEAFLRDWEQTKADVSSKGHDLKQNAGDTVKQAVGSEPIPRMPMKNDKNDWQQTEREARYGFGARAQYPEMREWDQKLESKLRDEWTPISNGRSWEDSKKAIRTGWDYAGKAK